MERTTFLYVMVVGGQFIKIGITSTSLKTRMKQVQTGCPLPIESIIFWKFEKRNQAAECEKMLHIRFSDKKSHGEWFFQPKQYTTKIAKELNRGPDGEIKFDIDLSVYISDSELKQKRLARSLKKDTECNIVFKKKSSAMEPGSREHVLEMISRKKQYDEMKKNMKRRNKK